MKTKDKYIPRVTAQGLCEHIRSNRQEVNPEDFDLPDFSKVKGVKDLEDWCVKRYVKEVGESRLLNALARATKKGTLAYKQYFDLKKKISTKIEKSWEKVCE